MNDDIIKEHLMKKSELKQLLKAIVTEVILAKKQRLAEAKGLSGNKKASEKKPNTQMKSDAKSITSTDKPVEKKEGKKLPVKDNSANTETDHFVDAEKTPTVPSNEKSEGKARPVGGNGSLKEDIIGMIREAIKAHRIEESARKNINKEIADLLAKGKKVYSAAIGRVGEIEHVDQNNVFIKLRRGKRGVTTFNMGDEVEIKQNPNGEFYVVNTEKLSHTPIQTLSTVNEMAKKAIAYNGKTLTGSISNSLRKQDPKSPTGWSLSANYTLKDGKVVPAGTPVDAPSMTGKNYVAKGKPGMGRPKATTSAETDKGLHVTFISPDGESETLDFDFLNSTWPATKRYLEANAMANLGDHSVDPNVKIGQSVYDAIEAAKEADLDGNLTSANNELVLTFDPQKKELVANQKVNEGEPEDVDVKNHIDKLSHGADDEQEASNGR